MIGGVVSPDPLVSDIGAALIERGATAIEAAVAMGAALSVTQPHFCGIGGDAVWVISDDLGSVKCILGIGQAPRNLSGLTQIVTRGPDSALTSAGAVDSWGVALDHSAAHWGGRMSLDALLDPAIRLAEEGFRPAGALNWWADFRREESADWPHLALPATGADGSLRQPDLARSLRLLARDGTRSFYDGALGRAIANGLRETGTRIAPGDLAATRATIEPPLTMRFGDTLLCAPPPPTQGATTLKIMGLLDRLDLRGHAPESVAFYHLIIEAVKQAFLTRAGMADTRDARTLAEESLKAAALTAEAASIDPAKALGWPQPFRSADTVYFAACDLRGNCASVLQSTYYDWGAALTVPGTGIIWHNRGAAFNMDSDHPNHIAPGKRPFLTLNPGIALCGGRPSLLYGTQGADGQPQTLAVLLARVLGYDIDVEDALRRPRFLLGRTFSDNYENLKLEAHVAAGVAEDLRALGHNVATIPELSPLAGAAGMMSLTPEYGATSGGHDPRGEGTFRQVAGQ